MPHKPSLLPQNYDACLADLKQRIRSAQTRAALAVNSELIWLYWQIGREILARQQQEGWGTKVINRLARDLKREFPTMKGLSLTNLRYMRAFADAWPEAQIVQQVVGKIPWGHNVRLLEAIKAPQQRLWYAQKTIENGWSRNVLLHQIDNQLYERQGGAITNFDQVLPKADSDLTQQILKSEYNFEFLNLTEEIRERELERALVNHIRDFLLELGMGFSFMGNQFRLEVEAEEYFVDLLFYHVILRRFIVIELKTGSFKPEYSGQLNFYVNVVDNQLRHPDDQPTIGIVLCRSKKQSVVEFALKGMTQPIGVSTYKLSSTLPQDIQMRLPTVAQLEAELEVAAAEIEAQTLEE
ncbi:MAG: DUF1016 domain-containing protein [Cyanothece sp. SIO1E1]|nr:DUF1016 domain-containing protein [Cyanothece sp. SIO1E1]